MNKRQILMSFLLALAVTVTAEEFPFGKGQLRVHFLTGNAVRLRYTEGTTETLPDWIYTSTAPARSKLSHLSDGRQCLATDRMRVLIDGRKAQISIEDRSGRRVMLADSLSLRPSTVAGISSHEATLRLLSPDDEHLYGLGQFQDGYTDVRGLSRRLTQVNTQIAIPMMISSKGYGLLWNNYGLTDFNPASLSLPLRKVEAEGTTEVVNVTSTQGGRREVRHSNRFEGEIDVPATGRYTLLLDVGQKMARRHDLTIDGRKVIDMRNLWLPPTASVVLDLTAGHHQLAAELSDGDHPTIYLKPVNDIRGQQPVPSASTVFRSPMAESVDFTVFVGSPDEVVAAYRQATGPTPMMPRWALGYIHCRERFHNQSELLGVAREFRRRQLPIDVIVQDWQYWGKYGWNAMRFDEALYPHAAQMIDSLHRLNMRLMVSVWSKVDKTSEVGRIMNDKGWYIPQTDWIDFFNPAAAQGYWHEFSRRLLRPYGIDAWWLDATEPENDDLQGRRVMAGRYPGELFRNVYPLMVNRTVYEGLRQDDPDRRPMILTRSGFPGIQRYGAVMWSGDVGNSWETLRRQITGGLGMAAAGMPWWTYDAGGFFRPGNQYTDRAYIERMLRWIETSVFLPLMRVHGYMSDTEPWRYGSEAEGIIAGCLNLRYRLLPYIYSEAAAVSREGSTLMRPLVFDFAHDAEALRQSTTYMFGKALLVSPVVAQDVTRQSVYLPQTAGGWYDFYTGEHLAGGQYADRKVTLDRIPVMVRAGSILPLGPAVQSSSDRSGEPVTLQVYPGADGSMTLYDDDGVSNRYEQGAFATLRLSWNDRRRTLTLSDRQGHYDGMPQQQTFRITVGSESRLITYHGKKMKLTF
jgi:alpha-D-xyloside xylohydrolase